MNRSAAQPEALTVPSAFRSVDATESTAALGLVDLGARFARARRAALAVALGGEDPGVDEARSLERVPQARREELFRTVFWNSWRLGRSAIRRYGAIDDPPALQAVLERIGFPCLSGEWRSSGRVCSLVRDGCGASCSGSADSCDYSREAIDGLVSGLSGAVAFARHHSRGHGAEQCHDVLYPIEEHEARFAPVPEEVVAHLAGPLDRLRSRGVRIDLLGIAENRLHVVCESTRGVACGPTQLYLDLLAEHLAKRFPQLELTNASSRAVLA